MRRDRPEPVVVDLRLTAESLLPQRPDVGQQAPPWISGLEPLARALAEHTRPGEVLWLVPEGPLHDLPLHAVTVAGLPWGERNPMSCTPSASLMRYRLGHAAVEGSGTRAALVLADSRGDLAHARAEARAIRAVLPATEVHLGASATLETLRERLSQARYDVVHLACHCRLDRERPSRSGILLADGELTHEQERGDDAGPWDGESADPTEIRNMALVEAVVRLDHPQSAVPSPGSPAAVT